MELLAATGLRSAQYALLAGVVLNLGNVLIPAALVLAGAIRPANSLAAALFACYIAGIVPVALSHSD